MGRFFIKFKLMMGTWGHNVKQGRPCRLLRPLSGFSGRLHPQAWGLKPYDLGFIRPLAPILPGGARPLILKVFVIINQIDFQVIGIRIAKPGDNLKP
jgi:hypothetical protein